MSRQGFSLLELSVVLTIIAIVIAGGLTLGSAKTQQTRISTTYEEMKEIANAISVFVAQNNRMPCPADTVLPATATYGRESATICTQANAVVHGDVPFYALGLPDEYGSDAWGHRYRYSVMDDTTGAFSSSYATSVMVVNDESGTAIGSGTDMVYVLASAGKSGKGAFPIKAVTAKAETTTDKDHDNWDEDVTFVDGTYNDGDITANFFDDILLWKITNSIFNVGAGGGGGGGGSTNITPTDIKACGSGNGNMGGYTGLHSRIQTACAGYVVCTPIDVVRYISQGNSITDASGEMWLAGVPDHGNGTTATDCNRFNLADDGFNLNRGWAFDTSVNSFKLVRCTITNGTRDILGCKFD